MSVNPPLDPDSTSLGLAQCQRWLTARAPNAITRERLLVVFCLWGAVALIYWPSSKALVGLWTDAVNIGYTHGFLVLAISLGLIVRDRARLAAVPVRPSPRALCALLILSFAWLYSWRAAIQDLHLLLLPLLLWVALAAVLGWRAARLLIFPVGFLYFAMPVWSDLVGILQLLSIEANAALIWLTGLPAYVTGDIVQVPAGRLEIAGGCSGHHSFVVGLALAALYGELARDPLRWRVTWIALMGLLAMIANWVRIFVIIAAAVATDMQTFLVTVDHYWFGWGVFLLAFTGFLWLAGRLRGSTPAREENESRREIDSVGPDLRVRLGSALAVVLCLGLLPALGYAADLLNAADGAIIIDWPAAPTGWYGPESASVSMWMPQFQNASAVSHERYVDERGQAVEVFAAAYRSQHQRGKLLGYGNSLLDANERPLPLSSRTEASKAGLWAETTVVAANGQRSLIWSRYYIGHRPFVRPRAAQLWYGVAGLLSPIVSSVAALRATCEPECAAAQQELRSVAARLQPQVRFKATRPSGRHGESR